jgi:D-3-phosphoglycerate dehydrogenase
MAMKVLVTEPIHENGLAILGEVAEVVQAPDANPQTIKSLINDCDAVLIRSAKITADIMQNAPNLKCVAKHGIGVDNIDVAEASRRGIKVVNAPFSNVNAVAEHTLSFILSMLKDMPNLDRRIREEEYAPVRKSVKLGELRGKEIGFIGLGRIAKRVIELLRPFGVTIRAFDPYASKEVFETLDVEPIASIEALLPISDVVLIHVPLTPETKYLLNAERLALMKPGSMLVNSARGGIVEEKALVDALENGQLRFAATDVFESEPPSGDNPLFERRDIIFSPHCAALTAEALEAMATQSAAGVASVLRGEEPEFLVNRDAFQN